MSADSSINLDVGFPTPLTSSRHGGSRPFCKRLSSQQRSSTSLLSQLGVPVAVTQAQLGHADPRITLQIYTHVPDAQRDAVDSLGGS
jgi:integrase